jgi:hypothetical protein
MELRGYKIDHFYQRANEFVCFVEGISIGIIVKADEPEYAEIQAYLTEHPEALKDEPVPQPPTDAELEAQAKAQRQALFAENDKPLIMYMRRLLAGDETARAGFEACNAYAEALRAVDDTPGWYLNPQWPPKPEI